MLFFNTKCILSQICEKSKQICGWKQSAMQKSSFPDISAAVCQE